MSFDLNLLAYLIPALPIWLYYAVRRRSVEVRHRAIRDDARDAGLTEPNSLHPVIDTAICIGCSACINACPEGDVLGRLAGKAALIDPTRCIGHGACQKACPVNAISLVFGTERRGVDIPFVEADFQTNVPGIYLAGEIGGMGLIRNAIRQGSEAIDAIAAAARDAPRPDDADLLDVLIVGAGPAGIAASLRAMELGLRVATVEQDSIGGTISHYPRRKLVMTEPASLPLYGTITAREMSKEALLALWDDVIDHTGLVVRCGERVETIERAADQFVVTTSRGVLHTRRLLLAIGRRGTPRTLDVPGEESSKVVYRLVDPAQYVGRDVLVVGGGDSALEAAVALAEQPGTRVTLAYRSGSFTRARRANRESLERLAAAGSIDLSLHTQVVAIARDTVTLSDGNGERLLANDDVVICAGGILPTGFLSKAGIAIERHFGASRAIERIEAVPHDPVAAVELNMENLLRAA